MTVSFAAFLSTFEPVGPLGARRAELEGFFPEQARPAGLVEFLSEYAGATFAQGAYVLYTFDEMQQYTSNAWDTFPALKGRALCFGRSWTGDQFAVNVAQRDPDSNEPLVVFADYGNGADDALFVDFAEFHNVCLVQDARTFLSLDLYARWQAASGPIRDRTQCASWTVPPILGGTESIENLSLTDVSVHLAILGQVIAKTNAMSPGTKIDSVTIDTRTPTPRGGRFRRKRSR